MIKRIISCFVFALLIVGQISAQQRTHAEGQILIRFENGHNYRQAELDRWSRSRGITAALAFEKMVVGPLNIVSVSFDASKVDENRLLQKIRHQPEVVNAQFNHFLELRATTPDDPLFDQQWQYNNTGQVSGGVANADLDIDEAWDVTTGGVTADGDTIVVCVIDSPFKTDIDFEDNLWVNHAEIPNNNIDDDNNGFVDDYKGWNTSTDNDEITTNSPSHGTAVAGIIGAKGNNGVGVSGVNWDVKLMLIASQTATEAEILEAYSYPLEMRKKYNQTNGAEGAFVVATNASWGFDGGMPSDAPLWCAMYDSLGTHGIINCGAAPNANVNIDEVGDLPTLCPSDYLIAVTNLGPNDQKETQAGYSSTNVDLGAYGQETYTLNWTSMNQSNYGPFGGTSGATPHVAGAIALMYAAPCSQLVDLAKNSPKDAALLARHYILNGVTPNSSLAGITVTEGRLNVNNSIQLVQNDCANCPAPVALETTSVSGESAAIQWLGFNNHSMNTLRWRQSGTTEWNEIAGIDGNTYLLQNLNACSNYELQLKAFCSDTEEESVYSDILNLKTDGCCEIPTDLSVESQIVAAQLTWDDAILAATEYTIEYKAATANEWMSATAPTGTYNIVGLDTCSLYEARVRTVCADSSSTFSNAFAFSTRGCLGCESDDFCDVQAPDASYGWIESVTFGGVTHQSGSDDGYAFHQDAPAFNFQIGSTVDITLQQGVPNIPQAGQYAVFIDFNQDQDFDDPGEKAFTNGEIHINPPTGQPGAIYIPGDASLGITRMRVIMFLGVENTVLYPCENIVEGEIEDYCVNITGTSIPNCSIPSAPTASITSEEENASFSWDAVAGAESYILRVKDVRFSSTSWTEFTTSQTNLSLSPTDFYFDCFEHFAVQVAAVCSDSEQSFFSYSTYVRASCPDGGGGDCDATGPFQEAIPAATSVELVWPFANAPYQNYVIRYKKADASNWEPNINVSGGSTATSHTINNLEECTDYVAQLAALCDDGVTMTSFSESIAFKTLNCTSASHQLPKGIRAINVYPNPFKNKLALELNLEVDTDLNIQLLNSFGQLLMQDQRKNLNGTAHIELAIDKLPAGVYFINLISSNGGSVLKKVVKVN